MINLGTKISINNILSSIMSNLLLISVLLHKIINFTTATNVIANITEKYNTTEIQFIILHKIYTSNIANICHHIF